MKMLVIFCGGTLVMQELPDGSLAPPDAKTGIGSLLRLEKRLKSLSQFDITFITNIDSTNFSPALWEEIADCIAKHYTEYDGFVITHGTDTMAYTASALSYVLGDIGKPVILTGAQIPGSRIESDARRNLINAVKTAMCDLAGVYIVFDQQIILGCRATKVSESRLNAFQSINSPPVGEIRVNLRIRHPYAKRHDRPLQLSKGFNHKIAIFTLFPGIPPSLLEKTLDNDFDGYILLGFGTGNIPSHILPFLEAAGKAKRPVVVSTQCLEGATEMETYDVGRQALELGAIPGLDMSLEAMTTKLMWALASGCPYGDLGELMHRNIAGEILA